MSRYIDANKLKKSLSIPSASIIEIGNSIMAQIDDIPTANVIEVVRCKDCKHFEAINNDDHGWCKMISDLPCGISVRYDDDYCSYGERAEA